MIVAVRRLLARLAMSKSSLVVCLVTGLVGTASFAAGQPPPTPPPAWEVTIGGAYMGTSGNSEASTFGADFALARRWPIAIQAAALAISTTEESEQIAERYLRGIPRGARVHADRGVHGRRAPGTRSVRGHRLPIDLLDAGLTYTLVRRPRWTLDALSSVAWSHEGGFRVIGPATDHPVGVLQALNKFLLAPGADTTQRFNYYPDFQVASAYRFEAEITAQASMTEWLALKFGYLWRYSNDPVIGFLKSDNTTTASVVLRLARVDSGAMTQAPTLYWLFLPAKSLPPLRKWRNGRRASLRS